MPTKNEAMQRPANLGEVIPPATPTAQHVPPIIPREQPGLSPASLGPAPALWTTEYDRVRQWVRPGTSQGRFPALPTKSNPQLNSASSSVAKKKIAPVQQQVNQNTANVGTALQAKFLGLWSPTVTYQQNNQISFFGNTYTALGTNLNSPPPSATWQLIGPTNLDSISDGTVFIRGTQMDMSTIIVQNASFEASPNLVNGVNGAAPPGWLANGATLSYETGSPFAGTQSLKVAAGVTGGGAKTAQTWACVAGQQFYVSAAQKSDGISLPNTILVFFNAAGTFIASGGASHGTGTSFTVDTGSVVAPPNAVSFYITCANANTGGAGICEFDQILVDRFVDPTSTLSAKGSTPSSLSSGFTFTATTSSLTLNWVGLTIFRADGSTTAIPNSGFTVSGLPSATTFRLYPYWDEGLSAVNFVGAGSGVGGGSGSPAIAFTAGSNIITQNQNLMNKVPLSSSSGFVAATTASGSSGGSGGGSGSCLREDQLVQTETGVKKIIDVQIGERVLGEHDEWQEVTLIRVAPAEVFIEITLTTGDSIVATPTHPFTTPDRSMVRAQDLSLSDFLIVKGDGAGAIRSIEVIKTKARKVTLTVEPNHTFLAGTNSPGIISHNWLPS